MIKYRLLKFLGAGGGGTVYRAFDLLAGIEVAIKVLHDGWDQSTMMRREIAALCAYSHPNIVKLLDTTTVDGAPALVLELAEKGELTQYLLQRLSVRIALGLARQVADALCLIHVSGGVHGDVKPPNIFVNAGGGLILGDFNLGNKKGCTVLFSSVAGGTPGYVAPEVADGYPSTSASDIYSLAVTVFEMLTACRPAALCKAGASPGTIQLERYRQDIPEGLSKLIQLATSLTPALRPTARGFQRELDRILGFLDEADAWQKRMPVLRVLRAKVRPFGKGMQGLHGLPFVVRGEYFDFVTQSPWHPDHRLQVYHAATNASGRFPQKIGKPFGPSFAIPANRTIRVFMGNAPQGGERFSPDPADQLGFDYQIFLGCGHVFSDRSSDGIFLVDTLSNQTVDVGVYEEIPRAGDLLVRVILERYLPVPTARPVGLPVVRALPGR
jgi:serine/threonine protein kinase